MKKLALGVALALAGALLGLLSPKSEKPLPSTLPPIAVAPVIPGGDAAAGSAVPMPSDASAAALFLSEPGAGSASEALPPAGPAGENPPNDSPSPAERRRIVEYSSLATVSPEELLRRFRFFADKVIVRDSGISVFPVVGKGFDLAWGEIAELVAFRLPTLTPWHELIVVEIVPAPNLDRRTHPPARVTIRTRLDLSPLSPSDVVGAAATLRRFAAHVAANANAARIEAPTRAWLDAGVALPQFATLRALARHDARLPDPGSDGTAG